MSTVASAANPTPTAISFTLSHTLVPWRSLLARQYTSSLPEVATAHPMEQKSNANDHGRRQVCAVRTARGEVAETPVLTQSPLILISFAIGGTPFTLVIPPILSTALFLSVLVVTVVTVDGRADVVDGAALVGLHVIIATIFWWG